MGTGENLKSSTFPEGILFCLGFEIYRNLDYN